MGKNALPNDCSKEQIEDSFSKMAQGKLKINQVFAETRSEAEEKADKLMKKHNFSSVDMFYDIDDILGIHWNKPVLVERIYEK